MTVTMPANISLEFELRWRATTPGISCHEMSGSHVCSQPNAAFVVYTTKIQGGYQRSLIWYWRLSPSEVAIDGRFYGKPLTQRAPNIVFQPLLNVMLRGHPYHLERKYHPGFLHDIS